MSDVTAWLHQLGLGDPVAVEAIWRRYHEQLMQLARKKLGHHPRLADDEEDVALSAYKSFCLGVAAGRFPQLENRDELWRVLMTITSRKAAAALRREFAQKRGGMLGRERALPHAAESDTDPGMDALADRGSPPDVAAMMAEQCERLMDLLEDPLLRLIAFLKLEGFTNQEIARSLECAVGTVERKLARIRRRWQEQEGL
jgi:DNA-directed RNA polymerase specialized sigma24 family protein